MGSVTELFSADDTPYKTNSVSYAHCGHVEKHKTNLYVVYGRQENDEIYVIGMNMCVI